MCGLGFFLHFFLMNLNFSFVLLPLKVNFAYSFELLNSLANYKGWLISRWPKVEELVVKWHVLGMSVIASRLLATMTINIIHI